MTVHFSDEIDRNLATFLQNRPSQPPSTTNETTLRLDPKVEEALLGQLKMSPRSEGDTRIGPLGLTILVLAGGLLFWWAIKHRPSAAPLVGAGGLAMAMIKNAEHLSRSGGGYFWGAVDALLGIGILLLVAGACRVIWPSNAGAVAKQRSVAAEAPTQESQSNLGGWKGLRDKIKGWLSGHPEPPKKESLPTLGMSPLILAWSLILLSKQPDLHTPEANFPCAHCPDVHCPVVSISPTAIGEPIALPVPKFALGDPNNPSGIEDLRHELSERVKEGDSLLLMGSADCTRSRRLGNRELAFKRASGVGERLKKAGESMHIEVLPEGVLPSYDGCKPNQNFRAVFPFLIPLKRDDK